MTLRPQHAAPIIRVFATPDREALWQILRPILRAGETYCQPREVSRDDALAYWTAPSHRAWIAEVGGAAVGSCFLCPNQQGGGAHVANAAFATDAAAEGRGVARAMLEHTVSEARAAGFRAMQFNFVIATNTRAIALWHSACFETVGRLPAAFRSPSAGYVDALVMYRTL